MHNQLVKKSQELNDFNNRFCKQLQKEATRTADLLKKCQSTPQAEKKAEEIKTIISQFHNTESNSGSQTDEDKEATTLLQEKLSYFPFK